MAVQSQQEAVVDDRGDGAVIYTFYSFKGGVGRSMAVANVAEWMRLEGARLVLIDWDLEAPGLENYFYDSVDDLLGVRSRPGLLDLLLLYREEFQNAARANPALTAADVAEDVVRRLPSIRNFMDPIPGHSPRDGSLYLITAGSRTETSLRPAPAADEPGELTVDEAGYQAVLAEVSRAAASSDELAPSAAPPVQLSLDEYQQQLRAHNPLSGEAAGVARGPIAVPRVRTFAEYASAVQDFDWSEFSAAFEGEALFAWMRGQLLGEPMRADAVFIDSRTGVTEMGGVCTRLLADLVVAFCATNRQNLRGSIEMARSFRRKEVLERRDDKPEVMLIPSRVDDRAEQEDLRRFMADFQDREREFPTSVFLFPERAMPAPTAATLARNTTSSFSNLTIPYFGKFSYEEALTFSVPGSKARVIPSELQKRFEVLGVYLALHAAPSSSLRRKLATPLQREAGQALSRTVLVYGSASADHAAALRRHLTSSGVALGEDVELANGSRDIVAAAGPHLTPSWTLLYLLGREDVANPAIVTGLRDARRFSRRVCLVHFEDLDWNGPGPIYDGRSELDALTIDLLQGSQDLRVANMAPPPPQEIVELASVTSDLRSALLEAARARGVTTIFVCGPVGTGKTTLVQNVCHKPEIEDAFPGGIFWMTAGREPRIKSELERMYTALTGALTTLPTEQDVRLTLTERLSGRRYLIVVDDLWNADDLKRLPATSGYVRVIVSRDPTIAADATTVVTIPSLEPGQRARLAGAADSQAGLFDDLVTRLHGWPPSLALARGELRQLTARGTPVAEALDAIGARVQRHGVLAFDRGAPAEAQAGTRILEAIRQAGEGAIEALSRLDPSTPLLPRLRALGLVDASDRLDPVVHEFLEKQGWLRADRVTAAARRAFITSADQRENPDAIEARRILDRGRTPEGARDFKAFIGRLKGARYFGYARQLCALGRRNHALRQALGLWLSQQHALCTYKDPDLPVDARLERARVILDRADTLATTRNQETLGIAGAIHKALWEATGQRPHLERALGYYFRGYRQGIASDYGYTAINAAYVLDRLAHEEEKAAAASHEQALGSTVSQRRRTLARQVRREIVDTLRPIFEAPTRPDAASEWWFLVTLAEACFGLGRDEDGHPDERWQEEARFWIREALGANLTDWEFESTARQFASLAQLQERPGEPADGTVSRTLQLLLGDVAAAESVQIGKAGLALSGGGFRASLFHIGVLARLAEVDALRSVEVLSCVSGGSIVGALYYLLVRDLLQRKTDADITTADYIELVSRLERTFLDGVQQDLRNRLYANPIANLRSVFDRDYTHTDRLGTLFEDVLFAGTSAGNPPLFLNELAIAPFGARADFAPKLDNWRRRHKVPILMLNAATLNTGRNWQFTVTWMGEPPSGLSSEIDANDLLQRLYYWEAPPRYEQFPFGRAVAASSAVPGLFDPVSLDGLYPDRQVRLTDGGVHDNQGVAGLLDQDCTTLLVSDGSGQLFSDGAPSAGHVGVPLRANSILQARVRSAEFRELDARRRSGLVRGLMFVHLTKGLDPTEVRQIADTSKPEPPDHPESPGPGEPAGDGRLRPAIQRLLSRIRTDLDAFSDIEARALMLSGYQLTAQEFAQTVPKLGAESARHDWEFLRVRPVIESETDRVQRVLSVASVQFGKAWALSPFLKILSSLAGLFVLLYLIWIIAIRVGPFPLEIARTAAAWAGYTVAAALAVWLAGWVATLALRARKAPTQVGLGLLLGTIGWTVFLLYRLILRPLYLDIGSTNPRARARRRVERYLATLLLVLGLGGAAALIYRLGGNPLSADYAVRRAEEYTKRGDPRAVLRFWDRVLALDPGRTDAIIGAATTRRGLGENDVALQGLTQSIERGVSDPGVYRLRGSILTSGGQYRLAIADYDAATHLQPDNGALWLEFDNVLDRAGAGSDPTLQDKKRTAESAIAAFAAPAAARATAVPAIARLYITVADATAAQRLDGVRTELQKDGTLYVPPARVVARPSPRQNALGFVFEEDRTEAQQLVKRLQELGIPVKATGPRPPGDERRRHFDLWLTGELPPLLR